MAKKKLGLKKTINKTTKLPSSTQNKWVITHSDMVKLLKNLEEIK